MLFLGRIDDGGVQPAADVSDHQLGAGQEVVAVLVSCEAEAFHYMRHLVDHLLVCHPGAWLANATGWNVTKH